MIDKSKSIIRFVLTYVCVLVPLIVIYLVFMNHTTIKQRTDNHARLTQQLTGAINALNTMDENYNRNGAALMEHQDVSNSNVLVRESDGAKVITLLKTVRLFDNVCDDIFVYYGQGNLYSAKGLSSIHAYSKEMNAGYLEPVYNLMNENARTITVLRNNTDVIHLLLRYPVRTDRYGRQFSVNYILSIPNLCAYLAPYFTESDIILKLDFNGSVIHLITYENQETIGLRLLSDVPDLTDYTSVSQKTTLCNTEIQMLYQPSLYEQELRASQFLSLILLCIGLAAALLISFIFSRSRWQRISNVIASIQHPNVASAKRRKIKHYDEFDYIQSLFEKARSESTQLEKTLRTNLQTMKQQTAMLIFYGTVQDPDAIRGMLSVCGVELYENYYYLCGVLFRKNDKAVPPFVAALVGDLYCVVPFGSGQLILMLVESPVEDHFRTRRIEMARHIREILQDMGAGETRIVMSQVYQSLEMTNYACMEILTMMESGEKQTDECWESRIQADTPKVQQLNPNDLAAFNDALQNRSQSDMEKVLRRMNRYIMSIQASDENRWYLRYCIVQSVSLAIRSSDNKADQALLPQLNAVDLNHPEAFLAQLTRIMHTFCSHAFKKEDFPRVIAYLEQNYGRFDLSLQELADYAKMSKSQMSRLFKAQTGMRYVDYLLRLRMTNARELLLNSAKPIKDIFPLVGYIEKSNFSRKYREYYGETPSETRKKAADEGKLTVALPEDDEDDEESIPSQSDLPEIEE